MKLWALLTAGCLLLATSADVRAQGRGGRESSGSERRGNSETSREGRERAERGSRAGGSEAGRHEGRDNDRSTQGLASERQHDATRSGETNAEAKRKASDSKASDSKASEAKASEAKASEAKASEAKASDSKASDSKAPDSKAPDSKAPDSKAPDTKKTPTHSEHAIKRGEEGRRTGPAFNDAQTARQSDVYKQPDDRYVVRGRNGREHVFKPDGTHVTSIDRTKAAHQDKVRRGERRPVTEPEYEEFKKIFQ